MLTARGDETDVVVGLEVGADDYIPKTCSMRQLLARIRAITRRAQGGGATKEIRYPNDIEIGELRVRPSRRSCFVGERVVELTPVEFDLLHSLAKARGRVKSRDELLAEIRKRDYEVFDRSIDMHISALRRKLGDDVRAPKYIRTYRSAGYMLIDSEGD